MIFVRMLIYLKHLLQRGALETQGYKDSEIDVSDYQFGSPYINRAMKVQKYEDLRDLLRDIGEDNQYCLKTKKNLAIECIDACIEANPAHLRSLMIQLKKEVNASETEAGGLAYIRQLRSSLWIIRQIRGLYGWSSTLMAINDKIDKAVSNLNPQTSNCFSYFSSNKESEHEVEEIEVNRDENLNRSPS